MKGFCSDCGASETERRLAASRLGGDPVCDHCEALRRDQQARARTVRLAQRDLQSHPTLSLPPWLRRPF